MKTEYSPMKGWVTIEKEADPGPIDPMTGKRPVTYSYIIQTFGCDCCAERKNFPDEYAEPEDKNEPTQADLDVLEQNLKKQLEFVGELRQELLRKGVLL